jgi:hypothetical protein
MKPTDLPPSKYAMDGDGKYWNMKTFVVEYRVIGLLTTFPLTKQFTAYDENEATEAFNASKSEHERFVNIYEVK